MSPSQRPAHKTAFPLVVILSFFIAGTLAIHEVEGFSLVDSFYATTMVATGQGLVSPLTPSTDRGKILISVMAILSVSFILVSFGYVFGTFFGRVFSSNND